MAHLYAHEQAFSNALELLVLVQQHPSSSYEIKEKAQNLWKKLTTELSEDVMQQAVTLRHALDLWQAAEELIEANPFP